MKTTPDRHPASIFTLLVVLAVTPVFGQPRPVELPSFDRSMQVNSISKLRVAELSDDGTELTLVMTYEYNGLNGSTALLVPVVDLKDHPEVSGWFGADMVTVPRGKGPVSLKIKFFNDEVGVPATIETDRIRVLILNHTGSSILGGKSLIRNVRWGGEMVGEEGSPGNVDAREELIQLAAQTEERAREAAAKAAASESAALKTLETADNELQRTEAQSVAKLSAQEKVEAEARATEAAMIRKEQKELLLSSDSNPQEDVTVKGLKSTVTNVEVVNRARDRSRVMLGIELELDDEFGFTPHLGVKVVSSDVADAHELFSMDPVQLGARTKAVLMPLVFDPPAGMSAQTLSTDQIVVFVTNEDGSEMIPLKTVSVPLSWRAPGEEGSLPFAGTLALQEFRQRSGEAGYATVKYHLPSGWGKLRVKVFDSQRPESVSWFDSKPVSVGAGRGLELVPVRIAGNGRYPGGRVNVDTVEVELVGDDGEVMARVTRLASIEWMQNVAHARN